MKARGPEFKLTKLHAEFQVNQGYITLAMYKGSVQCENTFRVDFKGTEEGNTSGNRCTGYVLIDGPASVNAC